MKKEHVPRRWRRFIPGRKLAKELTREAGSTAVLTGVLAGSLAYFSNDFLESVKESVRQGRHATRTIGEMITGTPGERAASDLKGFYETMKREGLNLSQYNQKMRETIEQRHELVNVLDSTYNQNETLIRQSERLATQLQGMLVEATAAGDSAANTATGGLFGKLDDTIINVFGDASKARENLPKLHEIYREARKFYDGREKIEYTVKEVCNHLERNKQTAIKENQKIDSTLGQMARSLDETYRVEGSVLSTTEKISLLHNLIRYRGELEEGELSRLEEQVENYQGNVNEVRAAAEGSVPIGPYERRDAWIDYGVNPLTIGLVGALAIKGLSSLTRPTRRALTTATLAPVYLTKKAAIGMYSLFPKKAETEELKKSEGVE